VRRKREKEAQVCFKKHKNKLIKTIKEGEGEREAGDNYNFPFITAEDKNT
jgi:hypothetical protein